jgi:hypothetical protein
MHSGSAKVGKKNFWKSSTGRGWKPLSTTLESNLIAVAGDERSESLVENNSNQLQAYL